MKKKQFICLAGAHLTQNIGTQTQILLSNYLINPDILLQNVILGFIEDELNCFCGIVNRRKAFRLISSRDHCQRSSPSRISDTPQAGF